MSRKVLITDTHCRCVLRETGHLPIYISTGSDAPYNSGAVYPYKHPILKKSCKLTFLFANRVAIRGLIRFYVCSKISLRLSNFWMPHVARSREFINLKQFELPLRERIIGSWRELDDLIPHDNHHSSRVMRTCHTHFDVHLGTAPGWWDDRIRSISLCYLPTLAWIFPTISAVHFLAFAFLAITFWSKECFIIGIEGFMSSGSVTNVNGTLFRMRNTFCWTVCCMNILLASAHSTASWSSHLNMKI